MTCARLIFLCLALMASIPAFAADKPSHTNQPPAPTLADKVIEATPWWANAIGSREYAFLPADAELLSGIVLRVEPEAQVVMPSTEPLPMGVYLVLEDVELALECGVVPVTTGATIGVTTSSSGVSVTCGAGFFACCFCRTGDNCPIARCRRNASNDQDCQAGGVGATQCSIGKADCP